MFHLNRTLPYLAFLRIVIITRTNMYLHKLHNVHAFKSCRKKSKTNEKAKQKTQICEGAIDIAQRINHANPPWLLGRQ